MATVLYVIANNIFTLMALYAYNGICIYAIKVKKSRHTYYFRKSIWKRREIYFSVIMFRFHYLCQF